MLWASMREFGSFDLSIEYTFTCNGPVFESSVVSSCQMSIHVHVMGQYARIRYLSFRRAENIVASLHICTDSPESSLLAYTKYGCR